MLLKGWPNVADSSYQVLVFPVAHPLLSCAYLTSIYFTVLMTLERFHAICLKGMAKKQESHGRIKLILFFIGISAIIFCIPKSMEYTWKTSDIRQDYDLQDREWTQLVKNISENTFGKGGINEWELKNLDHKAFLQNYRDIAESGTRNECKSETLISNNC